VTARRFLLNWVAKNIHPDAFRGGRAKARHLAEHLLADAAARGISKVKLEAVAEERLTSFLYTAMDDVALLEARLPSPKAS
jgi:hypothetical protein